MPDFNSGGGVARRLFAFDREVSAAGGDRIAGVDEAGRGPLAGPVVAAAVIFLRKCFFPLLNDSKKLSPAVRESLYPEIIRHAIVGVGVADEHEIDRMNIYQATRLAMRRAVLELPRTPDCLLVDGNMTLELPIPQRAVVHGDARSAAIAAASVVAKVFRDAWMRRLDGLFPGYGFGRHKGYPTRAHLRYLEAVGPSPVHRRSFHPVSLFYGGEGT